MIDVINRLIAPVRTRVMNMVARAVVQRVDDSTKLQLLQLGILDGETRDGLERFQNYGFTSVPEAGSEAVALFVAGRRDHGLVIAIDDRRYRPTGMQPGEAAIYDKNGSMVLLKANGDIEITPASGNVSVVGTLTATVDVVGGGKSLKSHTHPVSGVTAGTAAVTTGGPS